MIEERIVELKIEGNNIDVVQNVSCHFEQSEKSRRVLWQSPYTGSLGASLCRDDTHRHKNENASRFAQEGEDDGYLLAGEAAVGGAVSRLLQGGQQAAGSGDVAVQHAQGGGARSTGVVELGKFVLGIGAKGYDPSGIHTFGRGGE